MPDDEAQSSPEGDIVYANYWRRKQLLASSVPPFPVRRWWRSEVELCEIERVYFDAIRGKASLLDVGAGDLRIMRKFQAAGFRGEYHTQDIGGEYEHTYRSLDEVRRGYDAVICFDVIEHLPLAVGLGLVRRMVELINPGGVLILQTPNARCVRSAFGTDMTHLHLYNLADLWGYLTAMGLRATGHRVPFVGATRAGPLAYARALFGRFAVTRLLGCDYADNIAIVAEKPASEPQYNV